MLWVLAVIASIQIAQCAVCGISIITLYHLIPRIMFAMRLTGTVVKANTLAVLEAVGLGVWIVWRLFIRQNITLIGFLVFVVCVVVCCIIYFVDTESYVYIVEDDDEE